MRNYVSSDESDLFQDDSIPSVGQESSEWFDDGIQSWYTSHAMAFNLNEVQLLHYSSRGLQNQCQNALTLSHMLNILQRKGFFPLSFVTHLCIHAHRNTESLFILGKCNLTVVWVMKILLDTSHPPSSSVTLTRPRNVDDKKRCSHSTKPFCPPAKPGPSCTAPMCMYRSSCMKLLNTQTFPTLLACRWKSILAPVTASCFFLLTGSCIIRLLSHLAGIVCQCFRC